MLQTIVSVTKSTKVHNVALRHAFQCAFSQLNVAVRLKQDSYTPPVKSGKYSDAPSEIVEHFF